MGDELKAGVKSFLAGWAGGIGNLLVGHPFDTVKVRLQDDTRRQYSGAMDCVRKSIKAEGPLALYKGVTAPMTGVGLVFAIYFVSFDSAAKAISKFKGHGPNHQLTLTEIMACSAFTGVAGTCILGPAELLKVQQQTAAAKGLDGSMKAVCSNIFRTRGISGFFQGFGSTLARDVPGSMAWFGAFEIVKQKISVNPNKPTAVEALIAGGCGGLGMWLLAMPMDTVKTRVQATRGGDTGFRSVAMTVLKESGVRGFYRGFIPVMLRAFPANAACFAAKEMAQQGLDKAW